jgi:hypothetical protein
VTLLVARTGPERRMRHDLLLRTTLLAAVAGLAGCAAHRASLDDLPVQEYAGHFTAAPGASWFQRCGAPAADSAWWVTVTDRAVAQVDSARAASGVAPGQRSFVRWRAARTEGGEVGPRGPGSPALLVRELLELRPAAPGDCPAP